MQVFLLASLVPTPHRSRIKIWLSILGAVLVAMVFVFLNLGKWLVREDPLRKADAIAVLSGRMPERALEAARVYNQGYATRVWLTHSTEPAAELEKLSIPYEGEDFYDQQILIREGVPEGAIEILNPPIINTADEMKTIGEALKRENLHTVILVTSKVHTRRTRLLWKTVSGHDGEAIVRGDSEDSYDPAHWWRHTRDALDVVRELLGLMNAWAGLPLKPAG
jgi:uncharacterized SAM-binding protein YcdF (DUF218 family)